jgi:hypothetical protein
MKLGLAIAFTLLAACGEHKHGGIHDELGPITDYDLSAAGSAWKGLSVKVPCTGAKVWTDLETGARVAADRSCDIVWNPGKTDAAKIKASHANVTQQVKTQYAYTVDQPGDLEWTETYDPSKHVAYDFSVDVVAGGADYHCQPLNPIADKDQVAPYLIACRTLKK